MPAYSRFTSAIAAFLIASAHAELKPGACPVRGQNKPEATWDRFSMAGLWFEYVWEPSFTMDLPYECSTWIILSDEAERGDGQYVVYNNML